MVSSYDKSEHLSEFKNRGLVDLSVGVIKLYQSTISKVTPPRCRYRPSCSQYAIEAIERFGFAEGVNLARKRIKRCKPPSCGLDPVPMYLSSNSETKEKNNTIVLKKRIRERIRKSL